MALIQRFSTNFGVFSFFFDLAVAFGTIFLSRVIRPYLNRLLIFQQLTEIPDIPIAIYILFPVIWVFFLFFFSVYDGKKNLKVVDEFSNLTLTSLLVSITLAGLLYFSYRDISRGFFITYLLITFILLLLWRVIARALYKRRVELKMYQSKIIIVGAGPVGLEAREKLDFMSKENFIFIGYLDDMAEKQQKMKEVIGNTNGILEIVKKNNVDHIIIALPNSAHEKVDEIIKELQDYPVRISVIPDYFHLSLHRATLVDFVGLPVLELRAPALNEYQRLIKRIFDVLVTLILMIPTLPMMAIISLLILVFDQRPVMFIQNRVGENGRIIKVLKFRTMIQGADKSSAQVSTTDDEGNVIYKNKDDPRVTSLGKILRRFSLDELPQLFNIIRGTLSLVGPRPELPRIVEHYQPWQRGRLAVPQGLTGWWQVHGRSDRPLHLNIADDIYYIEHYSVWLDISIIIKTVWIVIRGKGAY